MFSPSLAVCLSVDHIQVSGCFVLHTLVGVQSIAVSMTVCLSVCWFVSLLIPKTTYPYFTEFPVHVAVARSSSDGSAIHYV